MSGPLTVWTNAALDPEALEELQAGLGNDGQLVIEPTVSNNLGGGSESALLPQADIAFGQPDPIQASKLPSLSWVHVTSAGYTRFDKPEIWDAFKANNTAFTNSSSVFDDPCSQHIVAFMLAEARNLPLSWANQAGDRDWEYERFRRPCRVLRDETVLILGFGAIARRVVELLSPYHLSISALRRRVKGDEPIPTYAIEELLTRLSTADHVINVLPANDETNGILGEAAFAACKPGVRLYNVGRGTTVDQPALIRSLEAGHVRAAYLDVTTPEPLPADDPLWSAPNCYITPHVAGGMQNEDHEIVRHFLRNFKRYRAGEPLLDRVV